MKQLLVGAQPLAARMLNKAPADGYRLWLDVTGSAADRIYLCEAPVGANPATDLTFRGVRLTLVGGVPVGAVEVAEGFAWNARATAPWSA